MQIRNGGCRIWRRCPSTGELVVSNALRSRFSLIRSVGTERPCCPHCCLLLNPCAGCIRRRAARNRQGVWMEREQTWQWLIVSISKT